MIKVLKIGSHVSMKGPDMLEGSVKEALSYGANTFMIYTGAPQNTRRKPLEELRIASARGLMEREGIHPEDVVIHAPYVMNLANPDPEKRAFAVDFLVNELERSAAIGARQIVLHPGAHVKQGPDEGIKNIIEGLNEVLRRTKSLDTLIALETMAGKGTECGRSFEELKMIIDGVKDNQRLSVCFDTCHTHDAGYDVKDDFDAVLKKFDDVIGISRISVLHINDSKNPKGAGKDRHANLGMGKIGFEALNYIVHHDAFKTIPKILETPYITENDDSKKRLYAPYKDEIKMLKEARFNSEFVDLIRARNH